MSSTGLPANRNSHVRATGISNLGFAGLVPPRQSVVKATIHAIAITAALSALLACDLANSPLTLEPDPRLADVTEIDSPEDDCDGRRCPSGQVCEMSEVGGRCIGACDRGNPGACAIGQVCLNVRPSVAGCFDRCEPFLLGSCSSMTGCSSSFGDPACILKGDAAEGQPCNSDAGCTGNLVCNRGVCRRACRASAERGEMGACALGEACERIVEGVGVCL